MTAFNYDKISADEAMELQTRADRIRSGAQAGTQHLFAIGRELIATKIALAKHDATDLFTDWVKAECPFKLKQAQRYMSVARLAGENDKLSLLPRSVLYRLAAKGAPTDLQDKVMDSLESETPMSTEQIVAALDQADLERAKLRGMKRRQKEKMAALDDAEEPLNEQEALLQARAVINRVKVTEVRIVLDAVQGASGHLVAEMLQVLISADETQRIGGTLSDNPYPIDDLKNAAWTEAFGKFTARDNSALAPGAISAVSKRKAVKGESTAH